MRSIFFALVIINLVVLAALIVMRSPAPSNAAMPVAERLSPIEGASLQLLHERDRGMAATKQAIDTLPVSAPTPVTHEGGSEVMCTMIGPYVQLLHAEYLVDRLRALDAKAEVRSIEVPDGMGYWVYLAPEKSEQAALRRLYELQAKKIDSYIIPTGELSNGISLGIFTDEAAAAARVKAINEQGYQAQVRDSARTISETWVVMSVTEAEKVDDSLWVDLLRQQSKLEKRQNYCLGVAPQ